MNGNILIVDDSPTSLVLLRDILTTQGYEVRPFTNGELAIRSALVEAPDLVLLDIRMPEIDGFEVCRRLKADERLSDIPVVFISAASDVEDKMAAFQAGGLDYIAKPFQKQEVIARVRTHIALHCSLLELKRLNETLELRIAEEVAKNREHDLILNQQARLAALGQMIHNIAHQWKQPLNALSIVLENIKDDCIGGEPGREELAERFCKARELLNQMAGTIDDFQNFFRPDRAAVAFDLGYAVEQALGIMSAALKNHDIELAASLQPDTTAFGFPNQFAHAVLNLVANAKEAIQTKNIPDGRIEVALSKSHDRGVLVIQDNAGGISEELLPQIFDAYFTTKDQGSGIGLYMTKLIVERSFGGSIDARNNGPGALFTISVPLHREEGSP